MLCLVRPQCGPRFVLWGTWKSHCEVFPGFPIVANHWFPLSNIDNAIEMVFKDKGGKITHDHFMLCLVQTIWMSRKPNTKVLYQCSWRMTTRKTLMYYSTKNQQISLTNPALTCSSSGTKQTRFQVWWRCTMYFIEPIKTAIQTVVR